MLPGHACASDGAVPLQVCRIRYQSSPLTMVPQQALHTVPEARDMLTACTNVLTACSQPFNNIHGMMTHVPTTVLTKLCVLLPPDSSSPQALALGSHSLKVLGPKQPVKQRQVYRSAVQNHMTHMVQMQSARKCPTTAIPFSGSTRSHCFFCGLNPNQSRLLQPNINSILQCTTAAALLTCSWLGK